MAELAQRYEIHPRQITNLKRKFLNKANTVFDTGKKSKKSEAEEKENHLLNVIGQLKVENDFLKDALRLRAYQKRER